MYGFACVCQKRGVEEELFMATVLFYISLYKGTIHPTFVFDGDKVIKGPIIIKSDNGGGRQGKSERNMQFRHDMHKMGAYIAPGLPNTTACTQEMDDLYKTFIPLTLTAAQDVFTRKTYERVLAVAQLLQDRMDGFVEDDGKMTPLRNSPIMIWLKS